VTPKVVDLNKEQQDRLGEIIFFHPNVIRQLEASDQELEDDDISSFEEYLKFKREVFNERKSFISCEMDQKSNW
jgi:ribosome-binding protein aMBF1 (putative translation factor)